MLIVRDSDRVCSVVGIMAGFVQRCGFWQGLFRGGDSDNVCSEIGDSNKVCSEIEDSDSVFSDSGF